MYLRFRTCTSNHCRSLDTPHRLANPLLSRPLFPKKRVPNCLCVCMGGKKVRESFLWEGALK